MRHSELFPFDLDSFYIVRCQSAGKCLVCGWKPKPEYAAIYSEWRMHFKDPGPHPGLKPGGLNAGIQRVESAYPHADTF